MEYFRIALSKIKDLLLELFNKQSINQRKVPEWAKNLPWEIIEKKSTEFNLDPLLVASIIWVESRNRTYAVRYEPGWSYVFNSSGFAARASTSEATEIALQSCSWGLMQVMGTVARELGYRDGFPKLCEPELGIHYGCHKLSSLFKRYRNNKHMISAYNQGSPRVYPSGEYHNQKYVNDVTAILDELNAYERNH